MSKNSEDAPAKPTFGTALAIPIPVFYANGFSNHTSYTDVTTILQFGPQPVAQITMPFSMAKSYCRALTEMLEQVEQRTGSPILSLEELMGRLQGTS